MCGVVRVAEDGARGAALAGGASAGTELRQAARQLEPSRGWPRSVFWLPRAARSLAREARRARASGRRARAPAACPTRPPGLRTLRPPRRLRRCGRPAREPPPAAVAMAARRAGGGAPRCDRAWRRDPRPRRRRRLEPAAGVRGCRAPRPGGWWGEWGRAARQTRGAARRRRGDSARRTPSRATASPDRGRSRRRPRCTHGLRARSGPGRRVGRRSGPAARTSPATRSSRAICSASARSASMARSASSSASAFISSAVAPNVRAADREPVGVVAMEAARQQFTGGLRGIGRILAAHDGRGGLHQPLARSAPGRRRASAPIIRSASG